MVTILVTITSAIDPTCVFVRLFFRKFGIILFSICSNTYAMRSIICQSAKSLPFPFVNRF